MPHLRRIDCVFWHIHIFQDPGDEKKDYITGAFAAEVPSNEEYREPTSLLAGRDDAFLKAVTALLGGGLRFVCMPSGPKLCVKPAR